ncbi:MAG: TIGR00725 family protein [Planctomycetes bacterium]|nr:TIGR00725 family protein [Planctomycetota bacterium]
MRKAVIGVMGGADADERGRSDAHRLGRLIAERGWVLLNGGRNTGVMAASAEGAQQAGGMVVGVLPDRDPRKASPHLDLAIVTGMGDARNVINVLSSDVVIACPGGAGTLSEVALALKNGKPVILLGFDPGPTVEQYKAQGLLRSARDPDEAVELAADFLESLPPR